MEAVEIANTAINGTPPDLFGYLDYLVFTAILLISGAIGLFYWCLGEQSTKDFLMGGRKMGRFPVAVSLLAAFCSPVALLGIPAEIYSNGTLYALTVPSYILVAIVTAYFYQPVFYNLQLTSVNEYLELRFSKPVRIFASAIFSVQMVTYMATVVYVPAWALSEVTGIYFYFCVAAIFSIVVVYTVMGGIKSVVWTNVVQMGVVFAVMIAIVVKGFIDFDGGFGKIWNIAEENGRVEYFNFGLDPRTRHSIWGLWIGAFFMWLSIFGVNQVQVQRYLTLPNIGMAKCAILANSLGFVVILAVTCLAGLLINSKYSECDPIESKRVKTTDQLLPIFIIDTFGEKPGFLGLFVAAIFSGALSIVSSGLHSLATTTLEDYVKYFHPIIHDQTATKAVKISVLVYGLLSLGLVIVADQSGGISHLSLNILGIIGGPLLGVFTLGMFFPWCNSIGASFGMLASLGIMSWLGIGTSLATSRGQLVKSSLDVSVEECTYGYFTVPHETIRISESGGILEFYKISYLWYSLMGTVIAIVVGLLISFLSGKQDPSKLERNLISPPVDKFVKNYISSNIRARIGWDLGSHVEDHANYERNTTYGKLVVYKGTKELQQVQAS